jgi:aldehyde:ferredoxin oxidoreductase
MGAIGMCLFIAFAMLDQPETFQVLVDMMSALLGLSMATDEVGNLGMSILNNKKDCKSRNDFTAYHDQLPDFLLKQKLRINDKIKCLIGRLNVDKSTSLGGRSFGSPPQCK